MNGNLIPDKFDDEFFEEIDYNEDYLFGGVRYVYSHMNMGGVGNMREDRTVECQGSVSSPLATFHRHFLLKYNNEYYDPSYGNNYSTLLELQCGTFAGIGEMGDFDEEDWYEGAPMSQSETWIYEYDVKLVDE